MFTAPDVMGGAGTQGSETQSPPSDGRNPIGEAHTEQGLGRSGGTEASDKTQGGEETGDQGTTKHVASGTRSSAL